MSNSKPTKSNTGQILLEFPLRLFFPPLFSSAVDVRHGNCGSHRTEPQMVKRSERDEEHYNVSWREEHLDMAMVVS